MALAAVALGAATDNPDIGLAGVAGMQAGMAQAQINFTRSHEEEADRLGIRTLASAGYEPAAMAGFFDRLGRSSRLYDGGTLPEFLRTHPVTSNRIADARGRAGEYPYRQQPDSLDYHLVRATLKANEFADPEQAVTHFRDTLSGKRFRNEEAQRFGYALALKRAKRPGEALDQLRPLLLDRPEKIAYMVTQAQLLNDQQRTEQALQVLQDGLTLFPDEYILTLYYTDMQIAHGQPGNALRLLEQQLQGRPQDQQLLALASKAAADVGKQALSHQYLAEHYYQSGAVEAAAQQLQIALQDENLDYYLSAQMSARLREFRQEVADMKARQ